jgi:hypothetical protein
MRFFDTYIEPSKIRYKITVDLIIKDFVIHHPAGTRMVRISDSEFDFDAPGKEIFMAKRDKS